MYIYMYICSIYTASTCLSQNTETEHRDIRHTYTQAQRHRQRHTQSTRYMYNLPVNRSAG